MLNNQEYPNYYKDNFSEVLDKLIDYITNLIENKSNVEGYIVVYGLNKFITKLNDNNKLTELLKKLKEYEKISLIVIDDAAKIKTYNYEKWFTENFSINDGIWIGKGIIEQNLLRTSNVTKEMTQEIKNNMGYIVQENIPLLTKLIDFVSSDEEEVDNNGK